MASWFISVFSSCWINTGYMFTSVYGGLWFRLRKLRSLRSCSSFMVVDIPFVTQRPNPMVQSWSMSLVCSSAGSSSAAAVHLRGRLHPCRCAEFIPWSRQFVRPGIPQLLHMVFDVPVVQVEQVHFPVVTQRPIPMVGPVWRTIEISKLQYAPGGSCPCCAGRVGLLVPS